MRLQVKFLKVSEEYIKHHSLQNFTLVSASRKNQDAAPTSNLLATTTTAYNMSSLAFFSGGKSDPYYKIRQAFGLGYQTPDVKKGYKGKHKCKALYKSEVVPNNLDPLWKVHLLDLTRYALVQSDKRLCHLGYCLHLELTSSGYVSVLWI